MRNKKGVKWMNKNKTLHVIKSTILSLKDDLHFYQEQEDEKGVYYTRGRLEALEQVEGLIEEGRLD